MLHYWYSTSDSLYSAIIKIIIITTVSMSLVAGNRHFYLWSNIWILLITSVFLYKKGHYLIATAQCFANYVFALSINLCKITFFFFLVYIAETPLDCEVSQWSSWGLCRGLCRKTGTKIRTRFVLLQPANNGMPCPNLDEETGCEPENCVWNKEKIII